MTTPSTASITAELAVTLMTPGHASTPLPTVLSYDPGDPYVVAAAFAGEEGLVEWTLSRDLLTQGLRGYAGQGDVRVWPARDVGLVYVALSAPDGRALLEVDAAALTAFLAAVHRLVPDGTEHRHIDIDALIAAILDAA